jgi:hypothetical protein
LAEKHGAATVAKVLGKAGDAFGEVVENLIKDPAGKYLKCYDGLGIGTTHELTAAMGSDALFKAVDEVGTAGVKEMLGRCRDAAQFARLCAKYGATELRKQLAEVMHADWLEAE